MAQEEPSYVGHAFKSQYNLIGLATAIGFALIAGTALPLFVAAGIEMVVLPLVASSERFQRLVRARVAEDEREEKQQRKRLETSEMLRALNREEFQRYRGLEILAGEIRQNYRGLDSSSQMLLDDLVGKLEFLLGFYLRMRYSLMRYENYFSTTSAEQIQERIAMLDHEIESGPERVREIKAKTKGVLVKRLERFSKAQENRQLIEAQTETVQEVLQLLRDQSFSMRDPRTITAQLDGLVSSAEQTERGVRDMEQFLADEQDLLMPSAFGTELDSELAALGSEPTGEAPRQAAPPPRVREVPPTAPASPPPRKKIVN